MPSMSHMNIEQQYLSRIQKLEEKLYIAPLNFDSLDRIDRIYNTLLPYRPQRPPKPIDQSFNSFQYWAPFIRPIPGINLPSSLFDDFDNSDINKSVALLERIAEKYVVVSSYDSPNQISKFNDLMEFQSFHYEKIESNIVNKVACLTIPIEDSTIVPNMFNIQSYIECKTKEIDFVSSSGNNGSTIQVSNVSPLITIESSQIETLFSTVTTEVNRIQTVIHNNAIISNTMQMKSINPLIEIKFNKDNHKIFEICDEKFEQDLKLNIPKNVCEYTQITSNPIELNTLLLDSTQTLNDHVIFSDILGEKIFEEKKYTLDTILEPFKSAEICAKSTVKEEHANRIFRYFNLLRSMATGIYAMYQLEICLQNSIYIMAGAKPLLIASMFFVVIDILIAFIQAFPNLWIFWNIEGIPFSKSWNIWSLIADHELLTDIFPIIVISQIEIVHFIRLMYF